MNHMSDYLAELVQAQFENRKPDSLPPEIDTIEICNIARENHMEYLLMASLLKLDYIDEDCKRMMRGRVMASVARTMTQVMEIRELEQRFEEAGVRNQPMKGARMKFIYPSPEMREMSDIDILIRDDSMEKATAVLNEMGYTLSKSIKHHDIYRKGAFMVIEAHRAMYDKTVDTNQYEYFSNMSRAVLRAGCAYTYDFNAEDFYIYMIAHMAKHFYAMGCGIRNLLDIYVYLSQKRKELDWEYITQEFQKLGLSNFAKHMEKLAFIWMERRECDDFYQQVFDYMMNSGIYGKDENGIWNKFADEKMYDKDVSRSRLRTWYCFPPISYMAEYYPWLEDRPYLLPVAWGIRAYRGIFLKKGIHKREMIHDIQQEKIRVYQNIYQEMELHFK